MREMFIRKKRQTNVGLHCDYNYVNRYVYIQEKRKQEFIQLTDGIVPEL